MILFLFSCDEQENNYNQQINEQDDVITIDSLKINRKVLIIGLDGFRSDALQESTSPFMHSLLNNNTTYYNLSHITEGITYSGPNWSSLLTGVHMEKHNVTDNTFENDNYTQYPPFFHYIEKAMSSISTMSYVNWTPINTYILSNIVDLAPTHSMNDLTVFEDAKQILSNENPIEVDVFFLHFDELDGAGHSHGFSPFVNEYTSTVNTLDFYAKTLFDIIEVRRSNGEDWLYFIVSDHGGEGTSHGDASDPNINRTIFIAEHPSIQMKAPCCYVSSMPDLAATILDFLGISSSQFQFNKDGESILE